MSLRLVRHQLRQRAPQPDRLVGQLAASAVALVEDQIDHAEDRGEAVGQLGRRRDAEGDAGLLDLALRAHEPLGHRLARHQEGPGDLVRAQSTQRPQRERDLGLEGERRVAAGEEQLEALVRDGRCRRASRPRWPPEPRAAWSSRRGCGCGGSGRWRGCEPSSPARRAGCPASLRGASARRRSRTPPERPPRRGRSRRGSRSGWRGHGPTRRGRPGRGSLRPLQRPDLDGTPHAGSRDLRRELDRSVEVVRLVEQVPAERLLHGDERAVGRQRLLVLSTRTVVASSGGSIQARPASPPASS